MNTRFFVFAVAPIVLSACMPARFVDPEIACRDRTLTLTHAPGYLSVRPNYIEVCRNTTIRIRLAPPVDVGNAGATPGAGAPEWLRASNGSRNEIRIAVPSDATLDQDFKYSLLIDGVGEVDPYVRIIR